MPIGGQFSRAADTPDKSERYRAFRRGASPRAPGPSPIASPWGEVQPGHDFTLRDDRLLETDGGGRTAKRGLASWAPVGPPSGDTPRDLRLAVVGTGVDPVTSRFQAAWGLFRADSLTWG